MTFRGYEPAGVVRRSVARCMPELLVDLGTLHALVYRSDRGTPGCEQTFIHFMESPVTLACDPEGRQLYLIGGRYRVTRRGIEG